MEPRSPLPLADVRILALSSFGAGPWATMLLTDLGADVIKIEDRRRGGDASRSVPPLSDGLEHDSVYFQSMNRNKRSLSLDIREPRGREIFERLVAVSDAVYNNLRGDQPEKLGLTYEALKHVNPKIVCTSCSGYGAHTSRAADPGYDFVVQATTGYMSLTGEPDGPPARCGVSVIDFGGGALSVVGLLAAVMRARATGRGGDVETSLYEGALSMLNYLAAWSLNLGFKPQRRSRSAHQTVVPVQTFETRDGWIFLMCMKDKFFEALCEEIGMPELLQDPRFESVSNRYEHREALEAILDEPVRRQTTGEWMERLRGKVPCAPVNSLEEALADPFLDELGALWDVPHPQLGMLREIACPLRFEGTEPLPRRPGPGLGADTGDILGSLLGLSPEEVAALERDDVV